MGKLIQEQNGELLIAKRAVHAPGYTILVKDETSGNGWTYYADDVGQEDFALPWKQPDSVAAKQPDSAGVYALGAIVSHKSKMWRSLLPHNVWEPGVSGWREVTDDFAAWVQPTGAHDAYQTGSVVAHDDKVWRSLMDANVWAPGVSGWREAVRMPPSGETAPPDWVQPAGGHDAYQIGDRVTYEGNVWVSTAANNVWAPGVYGWTQE